MNHVNALVLRENNVDFINGKFIPINCSNATVIGTYWRTPRTGRGVQTGYNLVSAIGDVLKPRADSVKVLRVRDNLSQDTYDIAVTDTGGSADFTDRCNACCDDVTPMPTVVIPAAIIEETACPDADGNRNFFDITRALEAGEVYDFFATIDGVALAATLPGGYASLAAFETWADSNWSPNTITLDGTKVTLTSATATTGSLQTFIKKYFESNTPAALTTGQHYILNATVNGTALPTITGAANGALSTIATAANANGAYAMFGTWSVASGKIRLISSNATSATLVVTIA